MMSPFCQRHRRSLLTLGFGLTGLLALSPAQGQTQPATSVPSSPNTASGSTPTARMIGPIEAHVKALQARFDQLEQSRRAWISSDWNAAKTLARVQDLKLESKLAALSSSTKVPEPNTTPQNADGTDPLFGLVLAVKDNIDVAGFTTTAGSRSLAGNVAPTDATVVSRLRKRGVIIVGKTNLDTFARGVQSKSEVRGSTGNAWNAKRAAGGSSGGSAVAIASGMADASLGTDTCGSLRYPATYNGVYSLRPTAGILSRHGVVPLSPTQDVVGPMASSPRMLRELFLAMLGPDPRDPATLTARSLDVTAPGPVADRALFRVGVLQGFGSYAVDALGRSALDALRIGGAELVPAILPKGVVNASLIDLEANAAIARYQTAVQRNPSIIRTPSTVEVSAMANNRAATAIAPWLEVQWKPNAKPRWIELRTQQRLNAKLVTELLNRERLDALVYPTTPFAASAIGAKQPSANCWLSATSGLPALALPGGFDDQAFPVVGVDLLGKAGSELTLLAIAQNAAR